MSRKKAPTDRSTKVRDATSNIEARDAEWRRQGNEGIGPDERKLRKILHASGVPEDRMEAAVADTLWGCGFHKLREDAAVEKPRPADEKRSLQDLLQATESFIKSSRFLADRTRRRIIDAASPATGYCRSADPLIVAKAAESLVTYVRRAIRQLPDDMGGSPGRQQLRNTLFGLSVIWHKYVPDGQGIKRSGPARSLKGTQYYGPLIDMAEAVLRLERVNFQSREAIGKVLWDVDDSSQNMARVERATQREDIRQATELDLDTIFSEAQRPPSALRRRRLRKPRHN